MTEGENHRAANLSNWESRVPLHVAGYSIDALLERPDAVSRVVAFDRERLFAISAFASWSHRSLPA